MQHFLHSQCVMFIYVYLVMYRLYTAIYLHLDRQLSIKMMLHLRYFLGNFLFAIFFAERLENVFNIIKVESAFYEIVI
jgi:hypothetical protein